MSITHQLGFFLDGQSRCRESRRDVYLFHVFRDFTKGFLPVFYKRTRRIIFGNCPNFFLQLSQQCVPDKLDLGFYSCILYDIQAFLEMFRILISILSTNEKLYMNFAIFEGLEMLC